MSSAPSDRALGRAREANSAAVPRGSHSVEPVAMIGERRRHLVLVTHLMPFPPDGGFARRVFELTRRLASRMDITVITLVQPWQHDAARQLESHVKRVIAVPHVQPTGIGRRLKQAAGLVSRKPHYAQTWRSSGLQDALDHVLATEQVDLVQLESSQLGWLRLPSEVPIVIDEHNVESQLLSRMASISTSPTLRAYYRFEAARYRRFEERLWDRSAVCFATSDADVATIAGRSPQLPVKVVPNAADVEGFRPTGGAVTPDSLLFVGLLEYRPNLDGIRYFIDEILPRIRGQRPAVEIVVVGRGPEEVLESLRRPGVRVTGWVPDVRPFLASAAVVVVPLRAGSGTRLKIVDAMAMGKPIVSTSIGAEGLEVRSGRHLLLADSPSDFADAVLRLLDHEPLQRQLGERARELAVEKYSWDRAAAALADAYAELFSTEVPLSAGPGPADSGAVAKQPLPGRGELA